MKFIRLLLTCLGLLAALAALLAAAAFVPAVQTWAARAALTSGGHKATLGSLSAGLGGFEITDLKIESDGSLLTIPSLEARVPLIPAAWKRDARVQTLVATGWTLDLSGKPPPSESPPAAGSSPPSEQGELSPTPQATAARGATRAFHGLLTSGTLPFSLSLDGVDLEGDVIVSVAGQKESSRIHVVIKGGGLSAGHGGAFTVDADTAIADPQYAANAIEAHGHLSIGLGAEGTVDKVAVDAEISDSVGRVSKGQTLRFSVQRDARKGDEDYALDLGRGGQSLLSAAAQLGGAQESLAGTWKADLKDTDLAFFTLGRPLPSFSAAGEGKFEAESSLARVRLSGRLKGQVGHLGILAPSLEPLGNLEIDASFDATQAGRTLTLDRLSAAVGGASPNIVVDLAQPVTVDEAGGRARVADPANDWFRVSLRRFPLASLSGMLLPFALDQGEASGDLIFRSAGQGVRTGPGSRLLATGVSVRRWGKVIASGLDVSLALDAQWSGQTWSAQLSPISVDTAGRHLASIEAQATRAPGDDQPVLVKGTWKADLDALGAWPEFPGIDGRSASGDFSASVGPSTLLDGTLTVAGKDPGQSFVAAVHAQFNGEGSVEFEDTTTLTAPEGVSDIVVEGSWERRGEGSQIDAHLLGKQASLNHLKLLAMLDGALEGNAPAPAAPGTRDVAPFWGQRVGHLTVAFDNLSIDSTANKNVAASFDIDHGSIQLKRGRFSLPERSLEGIAGSIAFNAAAEVPYSLSIAAAAGKVDAESLFPRQNGEDPAVEGHFSASNTLSGSGINLGDLLAHTREEMQFNSTSGIFRVLKTNIADAIPEVATPMTDTLGAGASVVGSLFGLKNDIGDNNKVSKSAQAVMDFTYNVSEFGFDQARVVATRGSDQVIDLVEMSLVAPDERLDGTGRIGYAKGLALRDRALSADLHVWVKGKLAEFLSRSGLLSATKDAQGFIQLSQTVHFGGTIAHIDQTAWHDLLAAAATRKPAPGAKAK